MNASRLDISHSTCVASSRTARSDPLGKDGLGLRLQHKTMNVRQPMKRALQLPAVPRRLNNLVVETGSLIGG